MNEYDKITGMKDTYDYLEQEYSKIFNLTDFLEILEIGNFCLDYTLRLQNLFINSNITSVDNFFQVIEDEESFFRVWKNNFLKLNSNVNLIFSSFENTHTIKNKHFDLVIIDIGSKSKNMIRCLKRIKKFKYIFILIPKSTKEKQKERNKVLDFLKTNNKSIEIKKSGWVVIKNKDI